MKRHESSIVLLLVLALAMVPAALQAAKPSAENPLLSPPDAPEASSRLTNARISTETGAALALYRLNYPVSASTPEGMARQYLSENFTRLALSSPFLADLEHHVTKEMPAGTTVRFKQTYEGIPVYGADLAVTISPVNEVSFVMNSYKPGVEVESLVPAVGAATARQQVIEYLGLNEPFAFDETGLVIFHHKGVSRLAHQVRIAPRVAPFGDFLALVDAENGELLRVWDKAAYGSVDGSGLTFDPDPLSSAGATYNDPGYTDGGDADTTELNAERVAVTLRDIEEDAGTFTLRGPWAEIRDSESPFEGLYSQGSSTFNFTRTQNEFEAVLVYWHVDNIMRYLNIDLGLTIVPFQYAGNASRFDPNGLGGADNAHYIGATGEIAFGHGGVDDSEDADVVIHELGHALHDWATSGGLSQVNGLSEGIGDFVAQSYSRSLNQWTPADPQYHWVFSWDGHNEFWNGRITNYNATWPDDLIGQVHTDGQIWATCMMLVWDALGRDPTELAHWSGIAMTNGSTNQEDAANAVMTAATNLGYTFTQLNDMATIFQGCGYGVTAPTNPPFFADGFESGDISAWSSSVP